MGGPSSRIERNLETQRGPYSYASAARQESSQQAPRPPSASPASSPRLSDAQSLQRSLVGLLTQSQPQSPAARNAQASANGFNPLSAARQALSQAASPLRPAAPLAIAASFASVARVYTVKKSGTRAEGMTLRGNTRKASKSRTERQASRSAPPAASPRLSSRSLFPQNSIPRPGRSVLQGATVLVKGSEAPVTIASKVRLLSSGIAVFLGNAVRMKVMTVPTRSVFFNPRLAVLSPQAQVYIRQLAVPLQFRQVLAQMMRHAAWPWQGIRGLFNRLFSNLLRANGAPPRGRMDRDFLNKLLRMRLRKRRLNKMNRKRVRRVSTNISRAVGKTKTADLKSYY